MKKWILGAGASLLVLAFAGPANAGKTTPPSGSGYLDLSFNKSGIVTADFSRGMDEATGAAQIPNDGSMIVVGHSVSNVQATAAIRLSNTGAIQSDFGRRGSFVGMFCPTADSVLAPSTFSSSEVLVPIWCPGTEKKLYLTRFNSLGYVAQIGPAITFTDTNVIAVTTAPNSGVAGPIYILTQTYTSSPVKIYKVDSSGLNFGLWATYEITTINVDKTCNGSNLAGIRILSSGQVVSGGTLLCPGYGTIPYVLKINPSDPSDQTLQIDDSVSVTGIPPQMTVFNNTTYISGYENYTLATYFVSRFEDAVLSKTGSMRTPIRGVSIAVAELSGERRIYLTYAAYVNGVPTVHRRWFTDSTMLLPSSGYTSPETTLTIAGENLLNFAFAPSGQDRVISVGRNSVRGKSDFLVVAISR